MTRQEAVNELTRFYTSVVHTEEDKFRFEEAQRFLIDTFHDPNDMHNLAWYYCEERRFDLYQKYLELAASYGFHPAYEGLGYIWYYGQNGTVDYEKAFYWFSKAAECPDGLIRRASEYKLADMYHNGYYVAKDEAKYKEIIERLYYLTLHPEEVDTFLSPEYLPNPGIYYRLAGIRAEEGRLDEARDLLKEARTMYAEYLRENPFWWGNIEEMETVVLMMWELFSDDIKHIDLYDIFHVAREECRAAFLYNGRRFVIGCIREDGDMVIKFDGKWFRNVRAFLEKAKIDGRHLTTLYDELYGWEVYGDSY